MKSCKKLIGWIGHQEIASTGFPKKSDALLCPSSNPAHPPSMLLFAAWGGDWDVGWCLRLTLDTGAKNQKRFQVDL